MSEPFSGDADQLREIRDSFKMSRREFGEYCGLPATRIQYLEGGKGTWRAGELEQVQRAITDLVANPPTGRQRGEARAARLQAALEKNGKALHATDDEGSAPRADYAPVLTFPQVDDADGGEESEEDSVLLTMAFEVVDQPVQTEGNGHRNDLPSISTPITQTCPDCGGYFYSVQHVKECVSTAPKTPASEYVKTIDVVDVTPSEVVDTTEIVPEDALEMSKAFEGLTRTRPLTNSEVHDWNRCRRKWWLTWYRGLIRNTNDLTDPRAVGTRIHRALAAWYVPDGQMPTDPRVEHSKIVAEDWDKIITQVDEHTSEDYRDQVLAEISTRFNEAVQLEKTIIEGYLQWLEETAADSKIHITDSEMKISAVIDGEVSGEYVRAEVIGLLDVRATRTSDHARLFMDHKSVSNFATPQKTLHMDPQMLHYMLLEAYSGTAPADEPFALTALYNMLRKVKRSASARPPFYERVEIHHSPVEIESYRKRLLGIARDSARATRELDQGYEPLSIVYPTPTRDCSWDCDHFGICPLFDDGSRVEDAIAGLYYVGDPMSRYADEKVE